jgi:hypothetical protein
VFEMLAQIQHKQKHGTSNSILSSPQRFSSTIDEDVRGVEDDSNNHKNNTSFSLRLESVGLVDNGNDSRWDDMFKLLLEFKKKHEHFNIPCGCGNENGKLGIWAINRRIDYRAYKRTNGQKGDPERMKRLESIGLVDDLTTGYEKGSLNEIWYGMYSQLLEFKQKNGHVKVPQHYNENPKLGMWVKERRRNYREYKRTDGKKGNPERMKCLESIGLVDDITTGYAKEVFKVGRWYDMYTQLLEFKEKHGHVKVPQRYSENPKLGRWVTKQRSAYREYKRTNGQKREPERMKHLESIGLVDDICITIHHDKMTNCIDIKVSTPMIVSSMSPTFSSYTQTITKETPLLAGMKEEEKNGDNSGGVNHTQADLDFLGSELRGKGGFWV